jgi:uncharacterized protein
MLHLDIGTVPEGLSHVDLTGDAAEWGDPSEGGRFESPVRASLEVTRNGHDIYLRGKASVRMILECGRCLEEYACDIEAPVELWVMIRGAGEATAPEERENVIEIQAGARYVDLTENIRTELMVLMPLKQVCQPDCKGLCPACGTNLNVRQCTCRIEAHDDRWDALKKLREKQ